LAQIKWWFPVTGTKRENPQDRLKKIKYRAHHRGTQEMDIILGGFVDGAVADYTSAQLDDLEALMSETDADLYNWIIGKEPLDNAPFPDLLKQISQFQHDRVSDE
jgi:antitoxin CptB